MAIEIKTLRIRFQSFYVGQHRVCYRVQSSGSPYTCTTASTSPHCAGNNSPCQYDISIEVDNETCDNVTFEGYVQAMCEPFESNFGRVPFSANFAPQPSCNRWRFTCDRGGVDSFIVTNSGSGYTSAPAITVNSQTGSGAVLDAVMSGDEVIGINVIDEGEGYSLSDTITIASPSSGVTALAYISSLSKCDELPLYECGGVTAELVYPTAQGAFISMCSETQPAAPSINWTMTQETVPCICSCANYTIKADGIDTDLKYYDCSLGEYVSTTLLADNEITACISSNSWTWYNGDDTPPLITNNGACS